MDYFSKFNADTLQQTISSSQNAQCSIHFDDLTQICLFKECKQYFKPYCTQCQSLHPDHPNKYIKSYSIFVSELKQQVQLSLNQVPKTNESLQNALKEQITNLTEQFLELTIKMDNINKNINTICNKIFSNISEKKKYYETLVEKIIHSKDQIQLQSALDEIQTVTDITDQLKLYIHFKEINDLPIMANNYKVKMEKLKNDLIKKCEQIEEQSLIYQDQQVIQNLKFSTNFKHKSINLSDCLRKMTSKDDKIYPVCFINHELTTDKQQKWNLKIINSVPSWIGVGVALKSVMSSQQFISSDKLGSGTYMLSSGGYFWSHHDKDKNSMQTSLDFTNGDTIEVEFDPIVKQIVFTKNKNKFLKATLGIQIPKGDTFFPCLVCRYPKDQVELF